MTSHEISNHLDSTQLNSISLKPSFAGRSSHLDLETILPRVKHLTLEFQTLSTSIRTARLLGDKGTTGSCGETTLVSCELLYVYIYIYTHTYIHMCMRARESRVAPATTVAAASGCLASWIFSGVFQWTFSGT